MSNSIYDHVCFRSLDSLLIDTGSSNTWAGANLTNPYVLSGTKHVSSFRMGLVSSQVGRLQPSRRMGCLNIVRILGAEFVDQITLAPGLTIVGQGMGASFVYDAVALALRTSLAVSI